MVCDAMVCDAMVRVSTHHHEIDARVRDAWCVSQCHSACLDAMVRVFTHHHEPRKIID